MYDQPLESQMTSWPRRMSSSASCCAYPLTPPPVIAPSDTALAQFRQHNPHVWSEYTGGAGAARIVGPGDEA